MNMRLDTRVQEDSIHLPRVIIQFSIIFSPLSSFPISKAQLMDTDETKKNNNEKFLSSCTLHCKINPNLLAKIGKTTLQKCSNYSIICRLLINSKRLLDRREKEGGETVSTGGNLYLLNRKQQLGPRDWMLDPMHFTWRIRSRSINRRSIRGIARSNNDWSISHSISRSFRLLKLTRLYRGRVVLRVIIADKFIGSLKGTLQRSWYVARGEVSRRISPAVHLLDSSPLDSR